MGSQFLWYVLKTLIGVALLVSLMGIGGYRQPDEACYIERPAVWMPL